jgi:hypothetical protein
MTKLSFEEKKQWIIEYIEEVFEENDLPAVKELEKRKLVCGGTTIKDGIHGKVIGFEFDLK